MQGPSGRSRTTSPLGGSGDNRGGGDGILRLVLRLKSLGDILSGLGRLVLDSLLSLDSLFLGGALSRSGSLLSLVNLGSTLTLDGSTELGESTRLGLLLAVHGSGGLLTLAEGKGERRLALLLDVLLGLAVDDRGIGGLSVDRVSKRSGRLDRRDDGSLLSSDRGLLSLSSLSRLSISRLLLLLAEDVAKDAVALVDGRLLLGALGLLYRLVLSSGNSDSEGSDRGLSSLGSLFSLGGDLSIDKLVLSGSLNGSGLLSLGEILLAEAEERGTLAAGRATLGLLSLCLLLGSLALLLGGILSLSLLGLGLLLGGLSGLLFLRSGLQGLESVLVSLGLGDRGGELLGLSNLGLDLSNPVVALSGIGGLESVLVALGSKVELVGAVNLGLAGISLVLVSFVVR